VLLTLADAQVAAQVRLYYIRLLTLLTLLTYITYSTYNIYIYIYIYQKTHTTHTHIIYIQAVHIIYTICCYRVEAVPEAQERVTRWLVRRQASLGVPHTSPVSSLISSPRASGGWMEKERGGVPLTSNGRSGTMASPWHVYTISNTLATH